MWLRLTERARKAIALAQNDARLSPDLVVSACLRQDGGVTAKMLVAMGFDLDDLRQKLEAITPDPGTESDEIIEMAEAEARGINSPYIGAEHLLLGIIRNGKCQSAQVLTSAGVSCEAIIATLDDMRIKKQ